MAAVTDCELIKYVPRLGIKSKKGRKRKSGRTKLNGESAKTAEAKIVEENDDDDLEVEEADLQTSTEVLNEFEDAVNSPKSGKATASTNGASAASDAPKSAEATVDNRNEGHVAEDEAPIPIRVPQMSTSISSNGDTEARLDALARERDALREEVAQLRRSLEEIQEKHEEDLISFREQLEETRGEKEHAETQFRNLLGKVSTIKSQLGDRLKADAVGLPI